VRPNAFIAALALMTGAAGTARAQAIAAPPLTAEQKQSRYEVGVMERVLEGAVEHGASLTRDRLHLEAALPSQMLLAETARVHGFHLAGYGVFFDVEVPPLDGTIDGTLLWTMRTLDQNDLGLQSALNELKAYVESAKDPDLQQALKRVELQVGPAVSVVPSGDASAPDSRLAVGSAASLAAGAGAGASGDPIPDDPIEAYHTEVMQAIMDVMLNYGGALEIADGEWLTVGVRRSSDGPRLAGRDNDSRTFIARITGAGLRAFRSGTVSKEEAVKRIEMQVF
jgi:hypothetical protein